MQTLPKTFLFLVFLGPISAIYGQKKESLQKELDSITIVLKENKKNKNSVPFQLLSSRRFQLEGELERLNVILNSAEMSNLEVMPSAFSETQKTRGDQDAPQLNYSEYLNSIAEDPCCKDISEWNVNYYNISYEEFTEIIITNSEINFNDIDYKLLQAAIFFETNYQRSLNNLSPLEFNQSLETAANEHAKDMTTYKFFSHSSPVSGKETVGKRAEKAGFGWSCVGENIAQNFAIEYSAGTPVFTPNQNGGYFSYEYKGDPILPHTYMGFAQAVVQQWMDSPGHRNNILSSSYKYMGMGCSHYQNSGFYMMDMFNAVQVFGM
jgi:uncharacterized protein YkwD